MSAERSYAALTAREQRVKRILLKELETLGGSRMGLGGLSYAQKQHLEKRLDVSYLDAEIARMHRTLRWMDRMKPWSALVATACAALLVWRVAEGDWSQFLSLLTFPLLAVNLFVVAKSTRRGLYIYEALRALSDADEIDVILDKAARDADTLIEHIVARELEAEARYPLPHRLKTR